MILKEIHWAPLKLLHLKWVQFLCYCERYVICILGDITSIVLKKAGLDDWLCDYVLITDTSTGKSWQFNFAGEKIAKYGTSGKLHFASWVWSAYYIVFYSQKYHIVNFLVE